MKDQSIDFIVDTANKYLSEHPDLRKGQSLYIATYNFLENYGTITEKQHFDNLLKDTKKDCFYFDSRINPFLRTLEYV